MKASQRKVLAVIVIFALGALCTYALSSLSSGTWQASGDGVTLYNTKTGEVRVARTGKVVIPADRNRADRERNKRAPNPVKPPTSGDKFHTRMGTEQKRRLSAEFKAIPETIASQGISSVSMQTLKDVRYYQKELGLTKKQVSDLEKWIEQKEDRNNAVEKQLMSIAKKYPQLGKSTSISYVYDSWWEEVTRPFRLRGTLSFEENRRLMNFLAIVVVQMEGQQKANFEEALELAKEYSSGEYLEGLQPLGEGLRYRPLE